MRCFSRALCLCMALLMAQTAHARCKLTGKAYLHTGVEAAIIKLRFGHINLTDSVLQPGGTLLGSLAVPPTDYTYKDTQPDDRLWECDKEDLGKIQFLVATNADWEHGGWHEVGQDDGLEHVYATAFKHVGLRLRTDGVTLTDHWRPVPVKTYEEFQEIDKVTKKVKDRIGIRLKDVPVMEAELYKVSRVVPSGYDIYGCHFGSGRRRSRLLYRCPNPNGTIQLDGPGLSHDSAGLPARTNYRYYGSNNGLIWGMQHSISLSREPTCVLRSATAQVRFATISVQQLQTGGAALAPFSIEVDCNGEADISGTLDNKTAIGLQVSTGAFAAAQTLGLVNGEGGVEYLLSDHYDTDPSLAKGVGIRVYDADGQRRWFVGQPGTVGTGYPRGNAAGWYPVLQDAVPLADSLSGNRRHRLDFTAKLVKLPQAQEVTPGTVRATAHVDTV